MWKHCRWDPVVDTAQSWACFEQQYLPEDYKPARGPIVELVEDLDLYMKHGAALDWF